MRFGGSPLAPHFDTESSYRLIYAYMLPQMAHQSDTLHNLKFNNKRR